MLVSFVCERPNVPLRRSLGEVEISLRIIVEGNTVLMIDPIDGKGNVEGTGVVQQCERIVSEDV